MFLQSKAWQQNQQFLSLAIEAGRQALQTPNPHPRSPAWPIRRLAEACYFQIEKEGLHPELWLLELLRMDSRETEKYVGWEPHWQCWVEGGEYSLDGRSMLMSVSQWLAQGLDLSRSPRDRKTYPEDQGVIARNSRAIKRIEKSLMPLNTEIVRRSFIEDGLCGKCEMIFDVWLADERSSAEPFGMLFHWDYREKGGYARQKSTSPIANYELEGFIAPKFILEGPCERRIVSRFGEIA